MQLYYSLFLDRRWSPFRPPPSGSKSKTPVPGEPPIGPEMLSFVWLSSKVSSIDSGCACLHSRHAGVMCVALLTTRVRDRCKKLQGAIVLFQVRSQDEGWLVFFFFTSTENLRFFFFGPLKRPLESHESSSSPLQTSSAPHSPPHSKPCFHPDSEANNNP